MEEIVETGYLIKLANFQRELMIFQIWHHNLI